MIQKFAERYEAQKDELSIWFALNEPSEYLDIVKKVTEIVSGDEYDGIDPKRIHLIDDGNYQGTLLFVIAAKDYQPFDYWYVRVSYGSCSGCDTLQSIIETSDKEQRVKEYMQLALHVVQGLHKLPGYGDDKD